MLNVKDDTYRISVGPRPRVNAPIPSVRHTVRTQSSVEAYFWPVAGVKPSVCILDLIISIGYITPQIFAMELLRGNNGRKKNWTHGIACSSTINNGVHRTNLVSSNSFLRHFPLYQFLVRQEIHAISSRLTKECNSLTFVDASNASLSVYFFNGIPWPTVQWIRVWLGLQA